jgi:1-acyl-sn-glycerol-3-phosphate acyltransferase
MTNKNLLYRFLKLTLEPYLRWAYRFETDGDANFPEEGGVIVVGNHVSFMDSFWIPMCTDRRVVFLAKSEYFESWKTAWFFRSLGMIPLKRGVRHKADAALQAGVECLQAGGVLGLYPEGTRSRDGRVHRGRTGVARLALASGCPVVPVGLAGSMDVMPKAARLPRFRGKVIARIGEPMRFDGMEPDHMNLRAITDQVMQELSKLSGLEYVDEYSPIASRNGSKKGASSKKAAKESPVDEKTAS